MGVLSSIPLYQRIISGTDSAGRVLNVPETRTIAASGTWYTESFNLTSEDSAYGIFVTVDHPTINDTATVALEGSTEGNGRWQALSAFGDAPTTDGTSIVTGTTQSVVSVFPAVGQSLPPYMRLKFTAGNGGSLIISRIIRSFRKFH